MKNIQIKENTNHDESIFIRPPLRGGDAINTETLAEVSEDEPHKNAAKIMLGTSKVSHKVSQLCRFADPSKPDGITAETRDDVINLLSHIESELDEFISSHPLPEGTIFDK